METVAKCQENARKIESCWGQSLGPQKLPTNYDFISGERAPHMLMHYMHMHRENFLYAPKYSCSYVLVYLFVPLVNYQLQTRFHSHQLPAVAAAEEGVCRSSEAGHVAQEEQLQPVLASSLVGSLPKKQEGYMTWHHETKPATTCDDLERHLHCMFKILHQRRLHIIGAVSRMC